MTTQRRKPIKMIKPRVPTLPPRIKAQPYRRPSPGMIAALLMFEPNAIEEPGRFVGIGPKTWQAMVKAGWVEWVSSPETNQEGYRITEGGLSARTPPYG